MNQETQEPRQSTAMALYHLSAHDTVPEWNPLYGFEKIVVWLMVLPLMPVIWLFWPLLLLTGRLRQSRDTLKRLTVLRELRWLVWMRLVARVAARCPNGQVLRSFSNETNDRLNNLFQGHTLNLKLSPWPDVAPDETLEVNLDFTEPDPSARGLEPEVTITLRARGERLAVGLSRALQRRSEFPVTYLVQGKRHVVAVGERRWSLPERLTDVHADTDPLLATIGVELAEVVDDALQFAGLNPEAQSPASQAPLTMTRSASSEAAPPQGPRSFTLSPATPLPTTLRSSRWVRLFRHDPVNAAFLVIAALMLTLGGVGALMLATQTLGVALIALLAVAYMAFGVGLLGSRLLDSFGSSAPRRWNRDALEQQLELTEAGTLRAEDATLDLASPFQVSLSQAPHTAGRLHVHLAQRDEGGEVGRLTVAVRCDDVPQDVPALDTQAPWMAPREFAERFWPAIQYYAALHGGASPWSFALPGDASTSSLAEAQVQAVATAHHRR